MPKPEKASAQFAMEIRAAHKQSIEAHKQSIEGILKISHTLIRAKQTLPHGAFTKMIKRDLPFDASTAQRYLKIASDPRLDVGGGARGQPETMRVVDPAMVKYPLIFTFLDHQDAPICVLSPPPGYGYQAYGLLICDLVRHVSRLFKVNEEDVFEWIEKERHKPTTTITGEIIGSVKGGST